MNYARIYREFIENRRGRHLPPDAYSEVHHIVPRRMGGGDDEANLITLTFRDHLFAHVLLARMYNRTEHAASMWGALIAMTQGATINGAVRRGRKVSSRKIDAVLCAAKAKSAEAIAGDNNPNADLNPYTFAKSDGRTFTGTRTEFSKWSGVPVEKIRRLVSGKTASTACGWRIPAISMPDSDVAKHASNFTWRANMKKARFINVNGQTHVMTRAQLKQRSGLDWDTIRRIVDGGEALSGWAVL